MREKIYRDLSKIENYDFHNDHENNYFVYTGTAIKTATPNERLNEIKEKYGISFICDNNFPDIDFYAVPMVRAFAFDSEGGFFVEAFLKNGQIPVCYIDKSRNVVFAAENIERFMHNIKSALNEISKGQVFNEISLYGSLKEAESTMKINIYNFGVRKKHFRRIYINAAEEKENVCANFGMVFGGRPVDIVKIGTTVNLSPLDERNNMGYKLIAEKCGVNFIFCGGKKPDIRFCTVPNSEIFAYDNCGGYFAAVYLGKAEPVCYISGDMNVFYVADSIESFISTVDTEAINKKISNKRPLKEVLIFNSFKEAINKLESVE